MAINTFLTATGDKLTVASNNQNVYGSTGTQTVLVNSGVTGTVISNTVERLELAGNMSTYKFVTVTGTGLQIQDSTGAVVGTIGSTEGATIAFADGSAALAQNATTFTIGGTAVAVGATGAAAAVTPTTALVTTDKSTVSTTSGTVTGQVLSLTTGNDVPAMTTVKDAITATNLTYGASDVIVDSSTTDADTFTLTTTANITNTPTIVNMETFTINAEKVGTLTIAGTSISGSTVTVNRSDLQSGAIDGSGAVTFTTLGANNVVAGTKVAALTVGYSTTANSSTALTVNGSAATGDITITEVGKGGVTVTGAAAQAVSVTEQAATATGSKATVNTSGTVTITNAVDALTVNTSADSTVTLSAIETKANSGSATLTGTGAVTLSLTGAIADAKVITNSGAAANKLSISAANATLDLTNVTGFGSVVLGADMTAITVAAEQLITTKTAQTATLTIDNVTGATTGTAKVSVLDNGASSAVSLGDLTFGATRTFGSVLLDATADKMTVGTIDVNDADLSLTGANAITFTTVTDALTISSGSTAAVTLSSNGNTSNEQTITTGAGDDSVTVTSATDLYVVNLGAGANTLTVTTAKTASQFVTGAGADTVTLTDSAAGTISITTGAGNDTVTIGAAATTTGFTIAAGADTDALVSTATKDASGATVSITGFESFEIASGQTFTVNNTTFAGMGNLALKGAGVFAIKGVDASSAGLTINAGAQVTAGFGVTARTTITGVGGADTLTGTNASDTITGGAGNDTLTGGGYGDTIEANGDTDTIVWTATSATAMATEAGTSAGVSVTYSANTVGDTVTGFSSGTDKLKFAAALVTNAAATETDTLLSVAKTGTITGVARFVHITDTVAGDNIDTHAGAVTVLDAMTTTAVAIGDSFIVVMDNDTASYAWLVKQVSASGTIATQDITLIGQISGTTFANGDFVSF